MKQKKIGIVIGEIDKSAGTQRAVVNLSNILAKRGYIVTIISVYTSENRKSYYHIDENVSIINLGDNPQQGIRRLLFHFKLIKLLSDIVEEQGIEYLLGTMHAFNCLLLFVHANVKKIACEHINYGSCPPISRIIRRLIYPKLDKVVLLTEMDKKKYSFVDQNKLAVIPNSLSFKCVNVSNVQEKKIIAVGRLTKQKGYDLLIEAAKKIFSELPDWKLTIFGEGEDEEMLQHKINEYKLSENVLIHKPVKSILEEMEKSSIFVSSARWEGFPLVLMEAIECGLPVVSYDCPEGPSEIVQDGENGYLVKLGDIDAFAEKVVELGKNYELRVEFGKYAHESAKRYSDEIIFEKWKKIFN
ncbi:MAG: glycosyltransferase family 4 protein [Agathobacter sp.]